MTEERTVPDLTNDGLFERAAAGISVSIRAGTVLLLSLALFASPELKAQQPLSAPNSTRRVRTSQAEFAEAEALIQRGSYEEAKARIQEQLDRNPSDVEAYNLLGIIYSDQKDYGSAVQILQKALSVDPKSLRTHNNLGNAYFAQGKLDLAEKEFRSVLRENSTNRDANYNLGILLIAKGAPAAAIVHFQRVRPSNLATRLNLARAYLDAGRSAEALRLASEISAQNAQDVQTHFTLGVLLASGKQYKAATMELEKANALQPESLEIVQNLGLAYFRLGEDQKSELLFNRALKINPDSSETLYLLAQVYTNEKRSVDALDLLARAHKLAPQNTDVIFLLARISMSQNYFEDAIPLLESGLQIAPKRADLHAALGESYFMSGKTEKAVEEFKALIDLDPSAGSYAFMGLSYRHLGRFDEAKKYFEEGLQKDPRSASCLFNVGYIEERQGNHAAAEKLFQQALQAKPDFADALLELANLRIAAKRFEEAADLLRRYVRLSRDPASGYYKLAMVERSLHQMDAAQRDLSVFQTLSKNASPGPYPYQHLFDYLDNRASLTRQAKTQMDLHELTEQINKHPDQPQDLYLLAETYLKLGQPEDARKTVMRLDQLSADDYRTQTGVGVLFAGYHFYDDAIQHFQTALRANPDADEVKYDLADAYFRKGLYTEALSAAQEVSADGQKDDAYASLLGDIYAHLGDAARAKEIFREAISRNPDSDQYYLSLALAELRDGNPAAARETLQKGLARVSGSGKLLWGLGIVSVLEGQSTQAADYLEHAIDLLPEWAGGYSALGVFYFQTGQIAKAREALSRLKASGSSAAFDVTRIEEALARAPADVPAGPQPMSAAARQQFLQFALSLVDRTL
jgi:tetratricopeptide (TPR) repeat protein